MAAAAKIRIPYKSVREAIGKPVHEFKPNTLPAKPRQGVLSALDVFAGAGGFSTALLRTAAAHGWRCEFTILNHWNVALDNARLNLGDVRVINCDINEAEPADVIPSRYVDIMLASPECVFFSPARGARPINDQRRSTAAEVLRFLEEIYVETLVLENVDEIRKWNKLDENNRPVKCAGREGPYFRAFIKAIKNLGYDVSYQTITACDMGDPTSRKRFYLIAQRNRRASFPMPTHSRNGSVPGTLSWVPARKIIDFNLKGQSIFARKEPHVTKTLNRVAIGFDDQRSRTPLAAPYVESVDRFRNVAQLYHEQISKLPTKKALGRNLTKSEQAQVKAVKAEAQQQHRLLVEQIFRTPVAVLTWEDLLMHQAVQPTLDDEHNLAVGTLNMLNPIITKLRGTGTTQEISDPLDTTTSGGINFGLAKPTPESFLVATNHGDVGPKVNARVSSLDDPTPTSTTRGSHGVVRPYILRANASDTSQWDDAISDVDDPLRTTVTKNNLSLVMPDARILPQHAFGGEPVKSPDDPVPTVVRICRHGLVQPEATPIDGFVIGQQSNAAARSLDEPGPTVAGAGKISYVEPFVASYYGESDGREHRPRTIDEPVPTQTQANRFGLVEGTLDVDPVLVSQHYTYNENPDINKPIVTASTRGAGYIAQPELQLIDGEALLEASNVNPTIVILKGMSTARDVNEPVPTNTAHAPHLALAEGSIVGVEGFMCNHNSEKSENERRIRSLDDPLATTTTRGTGYYTRPTLVPVDGFISSRHNAEHGDRRPHSLDDPAPTATCDGGGYHVDPTVDPIIIPQQRGQGVDADQLDRPLRTSTQRNGTGVAFPLPEGFTTPNFGERENQKPRVHHLDAPVPTATGHGAGMLSQPDISLIEPGKPYIIVSGQVFSLDILYRMLSADELAKSMSFSTDEHEYKFKAGTPVASRVKMIGNAVAVKTAMALIGHALAHRFSEPLIKVAA
jgi:DNA (cytosine-5)-methyltransferase 1